MESQASSEFYPARQDDEQREWPANRPSSEGKGYETNQAERAVMHPDRSDLEWRYYCHAWSN